MLCIAPLANVRIHIHMNIVVYKQSVQNFDSSKPALVALSLSFDQFVKMVHLCTICGYKTPRIDVFKRHLDAHANIKKKCEICGDEVASANLSRHRNTKKCKKYAQTVQQHDAQQNREQNHKIHTKVHLVTTNDGNCILVHDDIKFFNIGLILAPTIDGRSEQMIKCECGTDITSSNMARHKKSCDPTEEKVPKEIVIEAKLVSSLEYAGIGLNDIAGIEEHEIQINAKTIALADGSVKMEFGRIHVANLTLSVTTETN